MGVDDQLYKEDGTWITRIDNLLLKAAALVATPLLHEDDETYDRPFRSLLRFGSIMALISLVFLVSLNPTLVTAYLSIMAIGPWIVSLKEKCNGQGSTIDLGEKMGYLTAFTAMLLSLLGAGPILTITLGNIQIVYGGMWLLASTTVFLFVMFYLARLGAPPAKRKRARAHRFAWHH